MDFPYTFYFANASGTKRLKIPKMTVTVKFYRNKVASRK